MRGDGQSKEVDCNVHGRKEGEDVEGKRGWIPYADFPDVACLVRVCTTCGVVAERFNYVAKDAERGIGDRRGVNRDTARRGSFRLDLVWFSPLLPGGNKWKAN